jgi:hypothetical protein
VCLTSAMTNSGRFALRLGRMDDLRRSLPKECHGRNVIDSVCLSLSLPISLSAAKQAFFSCHLSNVIFRPLLCSVIQGRQRNQTPRDSPCNSRYHLLNLDQPCRKRTSRYTEHESTRNAVSTKPNHHLCTAPCLHCSSGGNALRRQKLFIKGQWNYTSREKPR